jgi:hypothetical protein
MYLLDRIEINQPQFCILPIASLGNDLQVPVDLLFPYHHEHLILLQLKLHSRASLACLAAAWLYNVATTWASSDTVTGDCPELI